MKYYVIDHITGVTEGVDPVNTLEEAIEKRDTWNKEDGEDFWFIIDENGNEVK